MTPQHTLTPDQLRDTANRVLRGQPFQEIPAARALRDYATVLDALAGINPEAVPAMRDALREINDFSFALGGPEHTMTLDKIRAIIARALAALEAK